MNRVASEREAKEFLVSRVVEEAQREGVSLSDVERKMLYFSETGWTLPDMMDVNDEFDREYDRDAYEEKVSALVRHLTKRLRESNRGEYDSWTDAVRVLSEGDHYILVMTGVSRTSSGAPRPPGDQLRLLVSGVIIVTVAIFWFAAGCYLLNKYRIEPSGDHDNFSFLAWAGGAAIATTYGLLWVFLGRSKANRIFTAITNFLLGVRAGKN
jgi:hypothetical protein